VGGGGEQNAEEKGQAQNAAAAAMRRPDQEHVSSHANADTKFFTVPATVVSGSRAALFFRRDRSSLQSSGRRECTMIVRGASPPQRARERHCEMARYVALCLARNRERARLQRETL
jgi:hypothetical protein